MKLEIQWNLTNIYLEPLDNKPLFKDWLRWLLLVDML